MSDATVATRHGKLHPEVKDQWVAALRSGDYQQGTGFLHYEDGGQQLYCCLGVLCDLAVKAGVTTARRRTDLITETAIPAVVQYGGGGHDAMPPTSVREWAFEVPPDAYDNWTVPRVEDDGVTPHGWVQLVELNDEEKLSFAEIADRIERFL